MSNRISSADKLHGDAYRADNRKRIVQREREQVEQLLKTRFSSFYFGLMASFVDSKFITFLFEEVVDKSGSHHQSVRHNYLVQRVNEIALEHGYDVVNFRPIQTLGSESTIHTPERFSRLKQGYEINQLFWDELKQAPNSDIDDNIKLDAQRLIFSIIWFGGITSMPRLISILEVIPEGVFQYKNLTWLETKGPGSPWRYLPDPVTRILLQRWYQDHARRMVPEYSSPKLSLYLKEIKFPYRISVRQLMEAAETRLGTQVEGLIPYVLRQVDATTSLSQTSWLRLITRQVPHEAHVVSQEPTIAPAVSQIRPSANNSIAAALQTSKRLKDILQKDPGSGGNQRKQRVIAAIQALISSDETPAIAVALCCWAEKMLKYGGRRTAKLAVSSIKRYLDEVSVPLIEQLWDAQNLSEMDSEEWEACYEQIIGSSVSGKQSSYRSGRLQDFHNFLTDAIDAPRIHLDSQGEARAVDAEILTPAEYRRALERIKYQTTDTRLATIQQLVLTLGYRCGLRRSEIAKLLIWDIQGLVRPRLSRPMLLVRPNSLGDPLISNLKSHHARRQISLYPLLDEEELEQLREWVEQRQRENGDADASLKAPLFSQTRFDEELINDEKVFQPITKAMQAASNCRNLRFHHLRHSFISITGLRLLDSERASTFPVEWVLDDDGQDALPHWGRDLYAIYEGVTDGHSTRQGFQLLSLLAGHASPNQTIYSYSHLLDYAAYCKLQSAYPRFLTTEEQAALLGVSEPSLRVFRSRNKLSGPTTARQLAESQSPRWPNNIRQKLTRMKKAPKAIISPMPQIQPDDNKPLAALGLYRVFYKIIRLQKDGLQEAEAIDRAAHQYDLSASLVGSHYGEAVKLMTTPKHQGNSTGYSEAGRSTVETMKFKDPVGGHKRPELPCCPAPPTQEDALPWVEYWYEKLINWVQLEPEVANKALRAFDQSVQRSHTQMSFKKLKGKQLYRQLINQIGLEDNLIVTVRPSMEPVSRSELKQYWSDRLSVGPHQIEILKGEKPAGRTNPMGVAQITVVALQDLGKAALQSTMSGIRFSVFMALITSNLKQRSQ